MEGQVAEIILVPSEGGRFEISVDEKLVFSKLALQRHAGPGEAADLIRKAMQA